MEWKTRKIISEVEIETYLQKSEKKTYKQKQIKSMGHEVKQNQK